MDPPPRVNARLEYTAPPGCPPASVLSAEYARRRGYDPFVEDAPLRVVATITQSKIALAGFLELYDNANKLIWSRPTIPQTDCLSVVVEMAGALVFRFDSRVSPPLVEPPPPSPLPPPPEPAPPPPVIAPPPAPPKRGFQIVAGLDGVFTGWIAPSPTAGFAFWAGANLVELPFSFELDLRSTWSITPADVPLAYRPHFAVRFSYISGILAGCWRKLIALCPVLEIGSMSFSRVAPHGRALHSTTVAAAGLRGVYERRFAERFFFRALVESEIIAKSAQLSDDVDQLALQQSPISLSGGLGFGGTL